MRRITKLALCSCGEAAPAKRRWWGKAEAPRPAWGDGTLPEAPGTRASSSLATRQSRDGGKVARGADRDFGTGRFEAGAAREAKGRRLAKPADAATANRRESYPEPVIVGYEEHRRMSIEETKGILGRRR